MVNLREKFSPGPSSWYGGYISTAVDSRIRTLTDDANPTISFSNP